MGSLVFIAEQGYFVKDYRDEGLLGVESDHSRTSSALSRHLGVVAQTSKRRIANGTLLRQQAVLTS
jgi:hypothetical protein